MNFPAQVVCGTGHRPQDTPAKFDRTHPWKIEKIQMLTGWLEKNRPNTVISGFALGWDNWLSYAALKLGIPLMAYIPFEGQELLWEPLQQVHYRGMLQKCTEIKYISDPGYSVKKMHIRNDAMVKDSDLVLALWNPQKKFGGTFSTVQRAIKLKKVVVNFWPETPTLL